MTVWALLRRRDFALLWSGSLVSVAGDWVLFVGLPLFVYDQTGSTLATGAMYLTRLLPYVLLGSVAGVFVDRWDRRRTMIVANLLLALALLPLLTGAVTEQLWLVYAAFLLISSLEQFVFPAKEALLPRLVKKDELVPANALSALNQNLARLGGPPLGGIVYGLTGLGGVVVLDLISFLGAALCLTLLRVDARPQQELGEHHLEVGSRWLAAWRGWLAGLGLVRRSRTVAVLLLFAALTGLGEGVLSPLFVPFVRDVLHGSDFAFGAILSAQAVGGLLGGLLVGRIGQRFSPVLLLGGGAVGLSVVDAVIVTYPLVEAVVAPALVLMVLVGVPVAGFQVGLVTLRQSAVEDRFRGRLAGAYMTTVSLAMMVGTVIASLLGEVVPIVPLLWVQVLTYFVGGCAVLALLPRRHPAAVPAPAQPTHAG